MLGTAEIAVEEITAFSPLIPQSCPALCNPMKCIAHQAPLSMGLSWQEYWSGLPFLPSGDLPDPEIKHTSPVSPAVIGGFFTTEPPGKPEQKLDGYHILSR